MLNNLLNLFNLIRVGARRTAPDASTAFEGVDFSVVNSTTFDTTVLNTLTITAEWSAADPLNSIYTEIVTLNKTY